MKKLHTPCTKENISGPSFNFRPIIEDEVSKEIFKLKNDEKSTTGINVQLLKGNVDVCAKSITDIFKACIIKRNFPDKLKLADISPIFKAVNSTAKKNYRPVSKHFKFSIKIV